MEIRKKITITEIVYEKWDCDVAPPPYTASITCDRRPIRPSFEWQWNMKQRKSSIQRTSSHILGLLETASSTGVILRYLVKTIANTLRIGHQREQSFHL